MSKRVKIVEVLPVFQIFRNSTVVQNDNFKDRLNCCSDNSEMDKEMISHICKKRNGLITMN